MKEHNMLTSIVCKMMIINMFYIIYFIISMNFLLGMNYAHSDKSIQNLKNKSEFLIQNQNFDLALDVYLKMSLKTY